MSQSCSIKKCNRVSRGLCDCCQQNLCLQHLTEHNVSLLIQLNPLTDDLNVLSDRLNTLNIDKIIDHSRRKLEQWRDDCHKQIDNIYEKKSQDLHQLVKVKIEQQRNELNRMQIHIAELIDAQETTRQIIDSLSSAIRQLQENLNNIENICVTIDTRPLIIDETFVVIEKIMEHEIDISGLLPVYKTISRSEKSFRIITNNDQYLLMHRYPNLCLFNHNLQIVKETEWPYEAIQDMCWSSRLDRFIVLDSQNVFVINQGTFSINKIPNILERCCISCTASDSHLFVCTNERASSIMVFTLVPRIELFKEWKTPITCTSDEAIVDIISNDGKLALMIMGKLNNLLHMQLRCEKTLSRIWSIQLNFKWTHNIAFRCCSLPCNEWLIMDHEQGRLLQITKDGKLKRSLEYNPNPYRATLLDQNNLVILAMDRVNLHRIQ